MDADVDSLAACIAQGQQTLVAFDRDDALRCLQYLTRDPHLAMYGSATILPKQRFSTSDLDLSTAAPSLEAAANEFTMAGIPMVQEQKHFSHRPQQQELPDHRIRVHVDDRCYLNGQERRDALAFFRVNDDGLANVIRPVVLENNIALRWTVEPPRGPPDAPSFALVATVPRHGTTFTKLHDAVTEWCHHPGYVGQLLEPLVLSKKRLLHPDLIANKTAPQVFNNIKAQVEIAFTWGGGPLDLVRRTTAESAKHLCDRLREAVDRSPSNQAFYAAVHTAMRADRALAGVPSSFWQTLVLRMVQAQGPQHASSTECLRRFVHFLLDTDWMLWAVDADGSIVRRETLLNFVADCSAMVVVHPFNPARNVGAAFSDASLFDALVRVLVRMAPHAPLRCHYMEDPARLAGVVASRRAVACTVFSWPQSFAPQAKWLEAFNIWQAQKNRALRLQDTKAVDACITFAVHDASKPVPGVLSFQRVGEEVCRGCRLLYNRALPEAVVPAHYWCLYSGPAVPQAQPLEANRIMSVHPISNAEWCSLTPATTAFVVEATGPAAKLSAVADCVKDVRTALGVATGTVESFVTYDGHADAVVLTVAGHCRAAPDAVAPPAEVLATEVVGDPNNHNSEVLLKLRARIDQRIAIKTKVTRAAIAACRHNGENAMLKEFLDVLPELKERFKHLTDEAVGKAFLSDMANERIHQAVLARWRDFATDGVLHHVDDEEED